MNSLRALASAALPVLVSSAAWAQSGNMMGGNWGGGWMGGWMGGYGGYWLPVLVLAVVVGFGVWVIKRK